MSLQKDLVKHQNTLQKYEHPRILGTPSFTNQVALVKKRGRSPKAQICGTTLKRPRLKLKTRNRARDGIPPEAGASTLKTKKKKRKRRARDRVRDWWKEKKIRKKRRSKFIRFAICGESSEDILSPSATRRVNPKAKSIGKKRGGVSGWEEKDGWPAAKITGNFKNLLLSCRGWTPHFKYTCLALD